jgi:tetratricopeptide (TPR) repeat protein
LYEAQGQHSKAREFYLRTKNIIEQQLGKDHPSNVDILQNLALFYVKTGEFTEAEPLLIRVLDLQTTFLGEEHPDTIRTQESLMNVRAKMI